MIILGVDTSCEQASCALYINGMVYERRSEPDKRKHSQTLMPMIDEFLKEHEVNPKDVDLFAVSGGPGSFTGLRIGMSVVKGMAYSLEKKISVIKSLDILANNFPESEKIICPVIDARNNQVYTAIYEWMGKAYSPVTDYMGVKIEKLASLLIGRGKTVEFCGDASMIHYEYFKNSGVNCIPPKETGIYPSAGVLVRMAAAGLGDTTDPSEAVPYYLRVSQAERFYGK